MRTKDIDLIFPRREITLVDGALIVDGASTKLITDTVTQNGVELFLRLEQETKSLGKAQKLVYEYLADAVINGVLLQDGNRKAEIKNSSSSGTPYKTVLEQVVGYTEKTDPEAWNKLVGPHKTTSTSKKVVFS